MGMSASQVRFLSLQNRKNDIGNQLMTLSNRKMGLSRDMNEVSRHYTQAMNQKMLKWSNDAGATYHNLSYDLMMKPNDMNFETPYIISTQDGRVVLDSVSNLLGFKNGDYATLTDAYFSGNNGTSTSDKINYENIAKWITQSTTLNGTNGSIYTTTDGMLAGTANPGAYVIPDGALEYGFENNLRYQIFSELGLVNDATTIQYYELLDQMFGSEEAYKHGNYGDLLLKYLDAGINQASRDDILSIGGKNFGPFKQNFGVIDTSTDTWSIEDGKIAGSLMGNLALAQHALVEYDNWVNQLKDFNLASDTTFTFTTTSGRTGTWTVQPFLNMNRDVDGIAGSADDNNGRADAFSTIIKDGYTVFDAAWMALNSGELNGNSLTINGSDWLAIYNSDSTNAAGASVALKDGKTLAGLTLGFLEGLRADLKEGNADAVKSGNSWTFNMPNQSADDYVSDGNGKMIPVSEAADRYATEKTVEYFGSLDAYKYGGDECRKCESREYIYGLAGNAGKDDTANVIGNAEDDRCFWHSILDILISIVGIAAIQFLGGLVGQVIANSFDWWRENVTGAFTDAWSSNGDYNTLDMNNVQKTYLTYYEMYMDAYSNGENLLDPSVSTGGVNKFLSTDKTAFVQALTDFNSATECNFVTDTWDIAFPGKAATGHYTSVPDSSLNYLKLTGAVDVQNRTEGGTVVSIKETTIKTLADGSWMKMVAGGETEFHYKSVQTADTWVLDPATGDYVQSTQQYNEVKTNGSDVLYYLNGTQVHINKVSQSRVDSYGSLKVAAWDTHFTNVIKAYLTPDSRFIEKLEKDVQSALDNINKMNEIMENFFSAKETKLMDYYDAMFLRIAEQGWVLDKNFEKNKEVSNKYLNNKLMNNDYFVSECKQKVASTGYNYTNKMAINVQKVYQVNDDDAYNRALSEYEAEKSVIQNKEKKIDARMIKLETEQEAINTELESVKKIVDQNTEKMFKIFA